MAPQRIAHSLGEERKRRCLRALALERAMQQLQSLHSHMHNRLSWDLSDISRQSMHKFIHSFGTVGTCVT